MKTDSDFFAELPVADQGRIAVVALSLIGTRYTEIADAALATAFLARNGFGHTANTLPGLFDHFLLAVQRCVCGDTRGCHDEPGGCVMPNCACAAFERAGSDA